MNNSYRSLNMYNLFLYTFKDWGQGEVVWEWTSDTTEGDDVETQSELDYRWSHEEQN